MGGNAALLRAFLHVAFRPRACAIVRRSGREAAGSGGEPLLLYSPAPAKAFEKLMNAVGADAVACHDGDHDRISEQFGKGRRRVLFHASLPFGPASVNRGRPGRGAADRRSR